MQTVFWSAKLDMAVARLVHSATIFYERQECIDTMLAANFCGASSAGDEKLVKFLVSGDALTLPYGCQ